VCVCVCGGGGGLSYLTLFFCLDLQVHGGEAQLVPVLIGQLLRLQVVAHAEATPHRGHLLIELLPCDFMVEAQPAELDLHTEKAGGGFGGGGGGGGGGGRRGDGKNIRE